MNGAVVVDQKVLLWDEPYCPYNIFPYKRDLKLASKSLSDENLENRNTIFIQKLVNGSYDAKLVCKTQILTGLLPLCGSADMCI